MIVNSGHLIIDNAIVLRYLSQTFLLSMLKKTLSGAVTIKDRIFEPGNTSYAKNSLFWLIILLAKRLVFECL